jgi:hypothetical protein
MLVVIFARSCYPAYSNMKAFHILVVILFFLSGNSSWLQLSAQDFISHVVAGDTYYEGYCITCFSPAMHGDE